MDKTYFQNFLKSIQDLAEQTKVSYVSAVSLYARFVGNGKPTVDSVHSFLVKLGEKGYSISSVNLYLAAIKKFFIVNGLPWDSNIKSKHVNLYETDTPTIYITDIKNLVRATKERGNIVDMSYLALSTIYGLRRGEMAAITEEDVGKKESTIHIKTLKGGIERNHLIPDEISFIKEYQFDCQSNSSMSLLFAKICLLAGYERKDNEGWHAIRRSIDVELFDSDVKPIYLKFFLRWAPKDMSERYFMQGINPIIADRKIFEKHPFLPFWR